MWLGQRVRDKGGVVKIRRQVSPIWLGGINGLIFESSSSGTAHHLASGLRSCSLLAEAKHVQERSSLVKVDLESTGANILASTWGQNGTRSWMWTGIYIYISYQCLLSWAWGLQRKLSRELGNCEAIGITVEGGHCSGWRSYEGNV